MILYLIFVACLFLVLAGIADFKKWKTWMKIFKAISIALWIIIAIYILTIWDHYSRLDSYYGNKYKVEYSVLNVHSTPELADSNVVSQLHYGDIVTAIDFYDYDNGDQHYGFFIKIGEDRWVILGALKLIKEE